MNTSMRPIAFAATLAALLAFSPRAHATPNFPAAIQSNVGASSAPACTVCHNNPAGGVGTVTTTFGVYMRSRGLVAFDVTSLQNALAADRAEKHVSNSSGIDDIDALARGLDPNAPNGSSGASPPEYGCAGRIARPARDAGFGLGWESLVAASLVTAVGRWRRSRRRATDECPETSKSADAA